jgi:hypothetical protein
MRSLVLGVLGSLCLLGTAAGQQPIPISPELSKFMTRPDEERDVKTNALRHWNSLVPDCGNPRLAGANVLVHVPPKFDASGTPISGSWQVMMRLEGCGQSKIFNVLYKAGPNGQIARTGTLPGTSIADPVLQKDGLMYAQMAMVGVVPADCKKYLYLDTAFEAFETNLVGARGRPWTERWTVRGCGVDAVVRMHFTPNATGTQITANTGETARVR